MAEDPPFPNMDKFNNNARCAIDNLGVQIKEEKFLNLEQIELNRNNILANNNRNPLHTQLMLAPQNGLNIAQMSSPVTHLDPSHFNDKGTWIEGKEKLSWNNSSVACYNPKTKLFRCVACNNTGFLSHIAEHYLSTHANAAVFQCPHCTYTGMWPRYVHTNKQQIASSIASSICKAQPVLDEIIRLLQNLKDSVEKKTKEKQIADNKNKRYVCSRCLYATDRRDLYNRHENIHKDEKPFHCYVCFKMFNRGDHVKKHFLRIHKEHVYDATLIHRFPAKTAPANVRHQQQPTQVPSSSTLTNINSSLSSDKLNSKSKKTKQVKTFVCTYCPWQGVDSWCLRRHLNTHIKPFSCSLCDYKAARTERLSMHVMKVHSKRLCNKCNFVADNDAIYEQHVIENHCIANKHMEKLISSHNLKAFKKS
ncbi:transcriptional repressor CTCF-like isoform X1 [Centruroides vittatus]|uniref:transcriptional repressor CTCF-like isoform X1 n=1 Tax=Centruroides vittatus TaxID=120091 RepID=UPI00350FBF32